MCFELWPAHPTRACYLNLILIVEMNILKLNGACRLNFILIVKMNILKLSFLNFMIQINFKLGLVVWISF